MFVRSLDLPERFQEAHFRREVAALLIAAAVLGLVAFALAAFLVRAMLWGY